MVLTSIQDLPQAINKDVCIHGRLVGRFRGRSDTGHDYARILLEESGCQVEGLIWSKNPQFDYVSRMSSEFEPFLELTGRVLHLKDRLQIKVNGIGIQRQGLLDSQQVVIPVLAQSAFVELQEYLINIPLPELQSFLYGVFCDKRISPNFFKCRGSANHHHKYSGGLLVHSVQVANLVHSNATCLGLKDEDRHLSVVGALLHDLGKIETVGESNPRPKDPGLFSHELSTIKLLSRHLESLARVEPRYGWTLEHLFHQMAASNKQKFPVFVGTDLIRMADQLSAAADNNRTLDDFLSIGRSSQLHPYNVLNNSTEQLNLFASSF
jgi:putative nucleotidyltransferase with HDIG domain